MIAIGEDFERYFELELGRSPALVQRCQRLRYTVFCQEYSILKQRNYPKQIESDIYDARAVHGILRYRKSSIDIATVRIILCHPTNPESLFPIERFGILRRGARDHEWRVPRMYLGEISRFCVLRYFRRRRGEEEYLHGISEQIGEYDWHQFKRWYPHITLGLFRLVVQMSRNNDVQYWYAVMEPSLIRVLAKLGIDFTPVGELVEYNGLRQPCVGRVKDILEGIDRKRPEVLSFINSPIVLNESELLQA